VVSRAIGMCVAPGGAHTLSHVYGCAPRPRWNHIE